MRHLMLFLATVSALAVPAQAACHRCVKQHHVALQKVVLNPIIQQVAVPVYAPQSYYAVGNEYQLRNVIAAVAQEMQLQAPPITIQAAPQQVRVQQAYPQPVLAPARVVTGCQCQGTVAVPAHGGCGAAGHCPTQPAPQAPPAAQPPAANPPMGTPEVGGVAPGENQPVPIPGQGNAALEQQVLSIFTGTRDGSKSCVACHGATPDVKGGLRLVEPLQDGTYRLAPLTHEQKLSVHFNAQKGFMPPSVLADPANPNYNHTITDAEIVTLTNWVRAK